MEITWYWVRAKLWENSAGQSGGDKRHVKDKEGKRELGVVQLCGRGGGTIVVQCRTGMFM